MGKRPGCYPEKCYLLWKKITLVLFCFLLFHLKNGHNTYPHFSNEIIGVTGFCSILLELLEENGFKHKVVLSL